VKKVLYIIGGLMGLLVVALLVIPSFINWNIYKPEIADQVRALTGRELIIGGDIDLKIFPSPRLVAENVSLSSIEGAQSPDLVSLRSVEVRIALAPLLGGNIGIETVQLIEPQVFLEVLADGRATWTLLPPKEPKLEVDQQTDANAPESTTKKDSGPAITLGYFEIVNGSVTYQDVGAKTTEKIADINLTVAAASLTAGPFRADGNLILRGLRLGVNANIGEIVGGRTFPIDLSIMVGGDSAKVSLAGTVIGLDHDPRFRGELNVASANIGDVVSALADGADLPAPLSQSFTLAANMDASAKALSIDDLKINFGGADGKGQVSGLFNGTPKLTANLTIDKIDADPWLIASKSGSSSEAVTTDAAPKAKISVEAAASPPAAPFTLPSGITASVAIKIGEIKMRGDKVSNAVLNAELSDGILNLGQFSLLAPGGSDLTVFGVLTSKAGKLNFDGQLSAKSQQPRKLMEWLDVDVAALKPGKPGALSLDIAASASPDRVSVTKLGIAFDKTVINGAATIALRDRLGVGASVNINQLDLDAYLSNEKPVKAAPKPETDVSTASPEAKKNTPVGGIFDALKPLTTFDANILANVGSLKSSGMTLRDIAADLSLVQGDLTIRKFSIGDMLSASTSITGSILDLGGSPKAKKLSLSTDIRDASVVAGFVGAALPVLAKSLGKVSLKTQVDGALLTPQIKSEVSAMAATMNADGQLRFLDPVNMFDLGVRIRHDDTASLLRRLGSGYQPAGKIGGLDITTSLKGGVSAFSFSKLVAAIGAAKLNGEGTVALDGARPKIVTTLSTGDVVVDPFLPAQKSASLSPTTSARVIPAKFWVPENGQLDFKHLIASISKRWSPEPVDLTALRSVDADVTLTSSRVSYHEYNLEGAKLLSTLNNGVLNMSEFSGVVFGGSVMSNASVNASGDQPKLAGLVTVGNMDIGAASKAAGISGTTGTLTTRIDVLTAGRSVADWVGSLKGAGAIEIKGIKGQSSLADMPVIGLALGPLLQVFEVLNSGLGSLIGAGAKTGIGETDVTSTFTIASGTINTKDTKIISNIYKGDIVGDINLPLWSMNVGGNISVDQGILGTVLANVARIPSKIPFQVTGDIDKPNVKIQSFSGASSAGGSGIKVPGLDKLEKKIPGVGGLLQGILGGGTKSQLTTPEPQPQSGNEPPAQQPQPQQQQQLNPTDLLRKLLQ